MKRNLQNNLLLRNAATFIIGAGSFARNKRMCSSFPSRWAVAVAAIVVLLLTGPTLASAGSWVATGSMTTPRWSASSVLLPDGRVLVLAGLDLGENPIASSELYDVASGMWVTTGSLAAPGGGPVAVLLLNGKVLAAGGFRSGAIGLQSAKLYDPLAGAWSSTGSMRDARYSHTVTLLLSGKVLVSGGRTGPGSFGTLSSAEIYDPTTGVWSSTGSMTIERIAHLATLLTTGPNAGKVLVTGGATSIGGSQASTELYDPSTETWVATGSMNVGRRHHTTTLLPNGKVLVVGGAFDDFGTILASAELYDPDTGIWSNTGSLANARLNHVAVLLPTGQVLVAGGGSATITLASTEIYDPGTGSWTEIDPILEPRSEHTAALLPNGKVLVAGGLNRVGALLASAELFGGAPVLSCTGFEPPMDSGPVTVKKNRALPLKAQLFDADGFAVTDLDIVAPPVIQVLFDSGLGGDPVDVTGEALPAGQGTEGNQFEFGVDKWQFNLKTKNYTAAGTYTITMISGDSTEYTIETCTAQFVIK